MYARTKFGIEQILGEEDENLYIVYNGTAINRWVRHYMNKSDAIKLSDKVEDLCDEFIIETKDKTFTWKAIKDYEFAKDNCDFKNGEKIIGIITRYDGVKVKVAETNYYHQLRPINFSIYKEE